MSVSLGEKLVEMGIITQEQLNESLELAKKTKKQLGSVLIDSGLVTEEQYTELLSDHHGVPAVDPTEFDIEEAVIKLIPSDVARKYNVVPLARTGATLTVVMADPTNVFALDE